MAARRRLLASIVGAAAAALLAPGAVAAPPSALPQKAREQIVALQHVKRSLPEAERKLDSRLVATLHERRGTWPAAALPRLRAPGKASKTVDVDLDVTRVDRALLRRLARTGAVVQHASRAHAAIRAQIPITRLAAIAAWPQVRHVASAPMALLAGRPVRPQRESKHARAARLRRVFAAPQPDGGGRVVSEGEAVHAVGAARAAHRVTGVGVKVCALSDGVDSLAASQASGDLPQVDVLGGEEGRGDEGTAMLEIIHDLAPGARLGFATAFTSAASFADNIRALRSRAGCDVLVDDILYFNEPAFQDGPIARAVAAVTADGALYFSSAGNEGNTLDGTSGHYEGTFADSGRRIAKFAGTAHDFDPGPGVQIFQPLSGPSSAGKPVTLHWAEPLGRAAVDYDLYLLDGDGDVVFMAQDYQDGDDEPYEILFTPAGGGADLRLAVVKLEGAPKVFALSALRGRFRDSSDGLRAFAMPGVLRGHATAPGAFAIAAAPAAQALPRPLEPGDPPDPTGPFPDPFTAGQAPERFTSDGPRRVFFAQDGTPLDPLGVARQQPVATAADGVSTTLPDFTPFFGTSAAVAHAAAIAALLKSGDPDAGAAEIREAFAETALDVAPAGYDGRTGYGILRADRALDHTGATPQPLVEAQPPRLVAYEGDGDTFLEPGEAATAALTVVNAGDGTATGLNVTVRDEDPRTTITPRSRAHGDLPPGGTASGEVRVALADDHPLGKPVKLIVRVAFAGALSPTTATFTLPTGRPAATPTTFAFTGPTVPIPDNAPQGAGVAIRVEGVGYAGRLTFSIDGETCTAAVGATTVGLDHTFVGDLVGTLTAPGGATATLFSRAGGGGNNLCQTVFDDAAAQPLAVAVPSRAPFTGSWRPADPLAELLDVPVDGDWRFGVVDHAPADAGSIRAVSLHFTGFAPA